MDHSLKMNFINIGNIFKRYNIFCKYMYLQLFSFFAGNCMYTWVTIKAHGSLVLQMQSLFTHIYWYKIVMIFLRILNLLLFVDYFQSNYYFKKGNFCYKYGIIKSIYILIFILISSCLINSLWKEQYHEHFILLL